MIISDNLKKTFCKDNAVPLKIYNGDIFYKRLKLFDKVTEWNAFVDFLNNPDNGFKTENDYYDYIHTMIEKITNYIKSSETFNLLNTNDCNAPFDESLFRDIQTSNVYKENNVGKHFISIDMRKANFSALVHLSRHAGTKFFDEYDYEKFIKMFTDDDYIASLKPLRAVMFGMCNPKRIVRYETSIVKSILTDMINKSIIRKSDIKSICSDEIILDSEMLNETAIVNYFNETDYDVPLKIECFRLAKLGNTKAYIKLKNDTTYELKCITPENAPFVYRFMKNESFTEDDKVFIYEGELSAFLSVPNINILTDMPSIKK